MPSRHLKGESTFPSESFRHLCKDDFKMYTSLFGIGFSFEHERSVNIIPLFWLVFLWSFVEVYKSITIPYGKRMMSYEKNASNVIVFVRAILIVKRRVESLRIGLFAIGSVGWLVSRCSLIFGSLNSFDSMPTITSLQQNNDIKLHFPVMYFTQVLTRVSQFICVD